MCDWGTTTPVLVKIPADLSHTGRPRWKQAEIDSCLASTVKALQERGIDMRSSCCGHGKCDGYIELQDGTMLAVRGNRQPEGD